MKKRCVAFTILLCCFLAMTLCAHADAPVNLSDISAGASYYFKNTTKLRAEVKNSYTGQFLKRILEKENQK